MSNLGKAIEDGVIVVFLLVMLLISFTIGPVVGFQARGWLDNRPANTPPPIHLKLLFWHLDYTFPLSLAAQRDQALAQYQFALSGAQQRIAQQAAAYDSLSAKYQAQETTAQVKIRTVTKTLLEQVHDAVPSSDDPLLANGWVRVHNEAAAGVSNLPASASSTDATPSAFKSSDALRDVVGNYGICLQNAERLQELQSWAKQVSTISTQ